MEESLYRLQMGERRRHRQHKKRKKGSGSIGLKEVAQANTYSNKRQAKCVKRACGLGG